MGGLRQGNEILQRSLGRSQVLKARNKVTAVHNIKEIRSDTH